MRTKVLPVVVLAALLGGGLAGCTEPEAPRTTSTGSAAPAPTSTPEVEAPPTGATGEPTAPASGAPAPDGGSTPEPVPGAEADGWTDETAYQACVAHATETEGAGYTWSVRAGQTMVYQDGRRTIDVAGIYTGGDVGVANVVYRCVLDGSPSDPRLDGAVVR